MVKSKRRFTTHKMALAGILTALVLENTVQNGLHVPAHAENDSEDDYITSAEWTMFQEHWLSIVGDSIAKIDLGTFDADDLERLQIASYSYGAMLYQKNAQIINSDPQTGVIDYTADIPGGTIYTGWYYRGGDAHSVCLFCYGENGNYARVSGSPFPCIVGDDFTLGLKYNIRSGVSFPGIICTSGSLVTYTPSVSGDYTLSFSGVVGSGIFASVNLNAATNITASSGANSIVILDDATYYPYSYLYPSASRTLLGCLKDTSNQPISNTRQQFVRGQVKNTFPDFLTSLHDDLIDEFPEDVVEDLWTDPLTPDVGSLDSLTFPPGLPSASFNDVELPSEPLPAKMLSGAGFWFTQFTNMLDALGVKYIVITFLIIALIMAILKI